MPVELKTYLLGREITSQVVEEGKTFWFEGNRVPMRAKVESNRILESMVGDHGGLFHLTKERPHEVKLSCMVPFVERVLVVVS